MYDPVSNRLIIFGGCAAGTCQQGQQTLNDVWVLTNADGSTGPSSWIQISPAGSIPPPRLGHVGVYDSTTNTMIIWSGDNPLVSLTNLSDVWTLINANGLNQATGLPAISQWIQLFPTGTPPTSESRPGREMGAGVYDPVSNRMIVVGGDSCDPCTLYNDVWVLTNANGSGGTAQWIQLLPSGGPPTPRTEHTVVYDGSTDRMILFGGGDNDVLNDTWVLASASGVDRSTGLPVTPQWIQQPTIGGPPAARGFHAAAYDSVTNQMIIFGGSSGYLIGPAGPTPLDDVWVLTNANGTGNQAPSWSQISPAGTPPPDRAVFGHWGLYNPSSDRMLVYGGVSDLAPTATTYQDVWALTNAISSSGTVGSGRSSIGVTGTTNPQLTVSEPITTGNGNYLYQRADFTIPGRGMPLLFSRSYNSLDNYAGPLGMNWTHSYNIVLTASATNAVVKWGDGHEETFTFSAGTYVPQSGVFSTLVRNADGTFVLTQRDQTQFAFSARGPLANIKDKNGNTILLTYGSTGMLRQVTDTVGRSLNFSYDASNRVNQITDPIGRTVNFLYDANNNLVQAADPAGGVTTFAYDTNHRVTSITLPNGQTLLTNTYDSSGRVITQTGGRGFSTTLAYDTPSQNQTTINDARGNQTIHCYDSSLRIVKITDPLGGTVSYTYDSNNDRISVTNQDGKITSFSYDSAGNITGITDPLSKVTAFSYDARNDLLTAVNPKGNATTFTYDPNGNLIKVRDSLGNATAFSYDGFGQLISKTDARGNATSYAHDTLANLTQIIDPLGHSTKLGYDGIGRLTSLTDPNGHAAAASYDALSRLTKIADPLANQTQFLYDAVGNLLRLIDANGNATSYEYDATNNLSSVTDALGQVTQYAYDALNNRVTFTNAKGNATSYAYDSLNRLSQITDPLSFVTSYSYDAVGNVLAVTDAKGQTNQFTYDALNRLLTIAYADGKNVAYNYDSLDRLLSVANVGGKVVAYAYDVVGNRNSLKYPDGKLVSYIYDSANRLSGVRDWFGNTTQYSYDPASNVLREAYPNGAAISFAYDPANRLTSVRNVIQKGDRDDDDERNPVNSFIYVLDAVGNRLQVTHGDGRTAFYGYDTLYELTSVTPADRDDKEGPDADDLSRSARYIYDAVGNRLSLVEHGRAIRYEYDAADRLLAAGTSTFTYDPNGNQTSKTQTASGQPIVYTYDSANRLIRVVGGVFTSTFDYDGDGNRISQSTSEGTFNYINDVVIALPEVLQESRRDGNISYTYGLGRISGSSASANFFYQYDGLGSVVGLADERGRLAAQYSYNAWGEAVPPNSDNRIAEINKFRFTSEALDPGTQLYYLRARYYDPSIGRFISRDQFHGFLAQPLSLNRYAYGLENPQTLTDPSGQQTVASITLFLLTIAQACAEQPAVCQTAIDLAGKLPAAIGKLWQASKALFTQLSEPRVIDIVPSPIGVTQAAPQK